MHRPLSRFVVILWGDSDVRSAGRELGDEGFPVSRDATTLEAAGLDAPGVEKDDVRLVVGADRLRKRPFGIADLRPVPALLLEKAARLVRRVGDVQPEVAVLGMSLDEVCVGDRLALAGASPRRPDVHEHWFTAEVLERDRLAVERRARKERALGGRRGRRRGCLLAAATTAAGERDDGEQGKHGASHDSTIPVYAGGVPGHWELIALGVVLLLLFGSKQLPSLARNLGRGVREVRETVIDVDPRTSLRELEGPREDERPAPKASGGPKPPGARPEG